MLSLTRLSCSPPSAPPSFPCALQFGWQPCRCRTELHRGEIKLEGNDQSRTKLQQQKTFSNSLRCGNTTRMQNEVGCNYRKGWELKVRLPNSIPGRPNTRDLPKWRQRWKRGNKFPGQVKRSKSYLVYIGGGEGHKAESGHPIHAPKTFSMNWNRNMWAPWLKWLRLPNQINE